MAKKWLKGFWGALFKFEVFFCQRHGEQQGWIQSPENCHHSVHWALQNNRVFYTGCFKFILIFEQPLFLKIPQLLVAHLFPNASPVYYLNQLLLLATIFENWYTNSWDRLFKSYEEFETPCTWKIVSTTLTMRIFCTNGITSFSTHSRWRRRKSCYAFQLQF